MKVLLRRFLFNGNTTGFHLQTQKLILPSQTKSFTLGKKVYLPSSLAGVNSGKMQLQTVKVSVKCLCYYVQIT